MSKKGPTLPSSIFSPQSGAKPSDASGAGSLEEALKEVNTAIEDNDFERLFQGSLTVSTPSAYVPLTPTSYTPPTPMKPRKMLSRYASQASAEVQRRARGTRTIGPYPTLNENVTRRALKLQLPSRKPARQQLYRRQTLALHRGPKLDPQPSPETSLLDSLPPLPPSPTIGDDSFSDFPSSRSIYHVAPKPMVGASRKNVSENAIGPYSNSSVFSGRNNSPAQDPLVRGLAGEGQETPTPKASKNGKDRLRPY